MSLQFTRVLDGIKTYVWPAHVVEVRATCPGDGPQGTLIVKATAGPDNRVVVRENVATVVALVDGTSPPAGSTFDGARNGSGLFTFSNGDLTATQGGTAGANTDPPAFTTLFHDSGKWVFRFTLTASWTIGAGECGFGLATAGAAEAAGNWVGRDANSVGIYDNGSVYIGGKVVGKVVGFKVNDSIDIVVDLTNQTIADSINGGALSAPVSIAALSSFSLSPALSGDQSGFQATFDGNPPVNISGVSPWDQ